MARLDGRTALHELLRRYFVAVSGVADTNFFRPTGQRSPAGPASTPYATVQLLMSNLVSYNLRRWAWADPTVAAVRPTPDLLEVLDGLDQVVVSVQFWRDGHVDAAGRGAWGEAAHSRAASLVKRLELSPSVELANQLGLGYATSSQVRDLSGVVDGNYEHRAQVDLTFYVSDVELVALNMFKSASLAVQVQQPDDHISEVTP